LHRALVSSYRLSIEGLTMLLTKAVWPQFAIQVFEGAVGAETLESEYKQHKTHMQEHTHRKCRDK